MRMDDLESTDKSLKNNSGDIMGMTESQMRGQHDKLIWKVTK